MDIKSNFIHENTSLPDEAPRLLNSFRHSHLVWRPGPSLLSQKFQSSAVHLGSGSESAPPLVASRDVTPSSAFSKMACLVAFRSEGLLPALVSSDTDGPLPPLAKINLTAARHTKSGHSCTLQHFRPRRSASRTERTFQVRHSDRTF